MHEIKIVEYQRKYAKSIAKMWNLSGESWGGDTSIDTEESIIAAYENSDHINTWLALDGEEVVGLCGFSEYREDEGASYIPILNVRPDYHGKKAGKALVLKAVEKACQCQWPRLDLYTWPGNTKAVPLYKKCGFFWEDRDDSTHLMNFIPYVLRTEAVAGFFQEADWYGDSVREIAVQPDGHKENGFEYFAYHWQHQGKSLRLEFERRGRGLSLIETDDWLVSASMQAQKLTFGRDYTINYHLVNKTGKPLEISIRGRNDKNIAFSLDRTVVVEDELNIPAQFHVGEIAEEQNVWHTHPTVTAELTINGKKALFKVGIVPKFPALLRAIVPEGEYAAGSQGQFFLNLENGYNEPAEFRFSLPGDGFIELEQRDYALTLSAGEKKAVPVSYFLHRPGLLQGKVEITAQPQSGEPVKYSQELTAAFAGRGSRFGGETNDYYFVANGRYMLILGKYFNTMEVRSLVKTIYSTYFMRPQLGLPYSVEFAKTKPVHVEWGDEDGVSFLRATYHSSSRPGIVIERLARLGADGLFSQQWSIINAGEEPAANLWFKTMINFDNVRPVLPLRGRIIEARDGRSYLEAYALRDLAENWIYSHTGNRGLCWAKDMTIKGDDWLWLETDLGTLAPGQQAEIKPVYLNMNTFGSWQEFREFALQVNEKEDITSTDSLEAVVNGGNPFVSGEYELAVYQHQKKNFSAQVTASSANGSFAPRRADAAGNCASLTLPGLPPAGVDAVNIAVETTGVDYQRQVAVFSCGGQVEQKQQEQEGIKVLTVDNGPVSFSAAPAFGPGVFSLIFQGQEWFDTSFPAPGPKSWWNPWLGGTGVEIQSLSGKSLLRQPRSIQFVCLPDNLGNQWQGLQIEVDVREHEKYQGLVLRQNVLTLPGLAGICIFLELAHKGLAINAVECASTVYLNPGGASSGSWVQYLSPRGQKVRLKFGEDNETPDVHKLLFGNSGCPQQLMIFSGENLSGYVNRDVILCGAWKLQNLIPGKPIVTLPQFYLFTDRDIPEAALEPLSKLRWVR